MATVVTHTMAASPGRLLQQHLEQNMDVLNSDARRTNSEIGMEDVFAKGETSAEDMKQLAKIANADDDYQESEESLQIEKAAAEDEDSEDEGGAVKIPQRTRRTRKSRTASGTASAVREEKSASNSRSSSEESSSNVDVEWEGESDTGGGREPEAANPNRCV